MGLIALIVAIALIAAAGGAASFFGRRKAATTGPGAAATAQGGRQQPGPAPPGKVWSAEHGHWHDIPAGAQAGQQRVPVNMPATTQTAPAYTPGPQPAGTPPPGKVWSVEHGHWHDAPK